VTRSRKAFVVSQERNKISDYIVSGVRSSSDRFDPRYFFGLLLIVALVGGYLYALNKQLDKVGQHSYKNEFLQITATPRVTPTQIIIDGRINQ